MVKLQTPKREAWWLALAALIFLIRFPVHFALDPPYLMDFEVYRMVAQRVIVGDARHLYDPTTSELMPFKYAPCWALLWSPLAWIPDHAGAVLWATLTVLWLILALRGSSRLCQDAGLRAPPWLSMVVVALLARPLTAEFLNGQADLLWACLVIGLILAEHRARPWRAAASLGLAIALKLPALIFLVYLLIRRRLGTVARVVAVLLGMNAISGALLNPAHPLALFQAWIRVLWSSGTSRAFEIGNQSLFARAGRFLSADAYGLGIVALPPPTIFLLTAVVSALLLTLVVTRPRSTLSDQARGVFDGSLLCILMVVCSPTVWIATYSALILPTAVAAACAVTSPLAARGRVPSALAALLIVALSLMTHSTFWKSVGIRYLRGESYVFLVLMILPWFGLTLFAYLWRQRSRASSHALLAGRRPSRPWRDVSPPRVVKTADGETQ
jgi:hypothetical protein